VGLALGAAIGCADRALLPLGTLPSAILVIGASLLLTGALHEDGLADTCDALGGGRDREHVLAILKDSRIGTFGGAALMVSIGGRAALLAQLDAAAPWALAVVSCAARVAPVWQMAALPYVTLPPDAKSRDMARVALPQTIAATAWGAIVVGAAIAAGLMTPARSGVLVLALAIVTLLTGWRYQRRAGGVTGDFLGATEQLSELAALAVLAWPK
jgi:adenosylcobinamide-GDP ribazoletransferase